MEYLKELERLKMGLLDLMTLVYFEVSITFFVQILFFFIPASIQRLFSLPLLPLHLLLQELQNRHHQIEVPRALHQYTFESMGQVLMTSQ